MTQKPKRFGEMEVRAFPEVTDHRTIDTVRGLGDFSVIDISEPIHTVDDKGESKEIAIVLAVDNTQKTFTFAVGGVVMEKVVKAKTNNYLPLVGKIELVRGKSGNKYNDIV